MGKYLNHEVLMGVCIYIFIFLFAPFEAFGRSWAVSRLEILVVIVEVGLKFCLIA